ncbi:HNH endonuclease [Streptomyces pseudogriseolus]|uniref:HNH endonuclease n=1 Tax=Streptomyces pseudogriseolus TaxID=36817 RepID=UPI003246101B
MSSKRTHLKRERRIKVIARLAERDGHHCFYCGQLFTEFAQVTIDHYVPYRLWRGWRQENLVLACVVCNETKGDLLPWPLVWLLLAQRREAPVLAA